MHSKNVKAKPEELLVDVIPLSQKKCAYPIQGLLAYATEENFLGRIVKGYHPEAEHICLMARNAAQRLCRVQNLLNNDNLGLFIFDGYRPLRAVKDFSVWMHQPPVGPYELERKQIHYPHLEKAELSHLGYIAKGVSKHCFGSTVDLTLIDLKTNQFLEMGACFDYFDDIAHATAPASVIGQTAFTNRQKLSAAMQSVGFIPYSKEYWHFDHPDLETDTPIDIEITIGLGT